MNRVGIIPMLLIFALLTSSVGASSPKPATGAEDTYLLSNAVIADVVRTMENKNSVQEAALSDDQILEMYPDLNMTKPKIPPVSVMSGKIPDHLIVKMADYLFGLLQGTGEVIKPTTTTTTTTTPPPPPPPKPSPEFLPFRPTNQPFFDDLAVLRAAPKTAESPHFVGQVRRKPAARKLSGLSKQKSEKLWRKTRMVKLFGMA